MKETACTLNLMSKVRVKTNKSYEEKFPEKALDVTGTIVSILDAYKEISNPIILRYYGKHSPNVRRCDVDRVVIRSNGRFCVVPYATDIYTFDEVEDKDEA